MTESAFTTAAIEWLKLKWGDDPGPACPMCGEIDWNVGDKTRIALEGARFTTVRVFPVECNGCRLILWVNGEQIATPEKPPVEEKGA